MDDVNVLEYVAPWPLYALAWSSSSLPHNVASSSRWSGSARNSMGAASSSSSALANAGIPRDARMAVGSFVDEYTNRIQVLGVASDEYGQPCLRPVADAPHSYPASRIAFQPSTLDDPLGTSSSSTTSRRHSGAKAAKNRASWGTYGSQSAEELDEEVRYPDRELLATTADSLRIWECTREEEGGSTSYVGSRDAKTELPFGLREKSVLAHSKSTNTTSAPLTSFSWNTPSPNLIVTSSIDTTCTIWDLPTRTALTQLIAHDREVYDVDWCPGSADVFASVGADGSVRVFDLRSLEHSTIIYETGGPLPGSSGVNNGDDGRPGSGMSSETLAAPLLRIAFNPWDANYLATFHLDSDTVQILDVRAPGSPILELRGHQGSINALAWGPPGTGLGTNGSGSSKGMICTAGDDSQCLVYDLASATLRSASAQGRRSRNGAGPSPAPSADSRSSMAATIGAEVPALAYTASEMVNNVAWLRLPTNGFSGTGLGAGGAAGTSASSGKAGIAQEWNDYTAGASKSRARTGPDVDWLALVSGRSVRALRV